MNDYKKCAFNYVILSKMWRNCYQMVKLCLFVSWTNEGTMLSTYNQSKVELRHWHREESRNYSFCTKLQVSACFTNKSQCYQFICHTPTEEIQEITNPKNKFLKAKYQRSIAAFDITIHRLTISVPFFILPVFW